MSQIPGMTLPPSPTGRFAEQPEDGLGGVDINIPVRVVYTTDDPDAKPFKMTYARQHYFIIPNEPRGTMVPYLCMCMYLGDPRSFDVPGEKMELKHRRKELERLRVHWGVYDREDMWSTLPPLKAYPLDSDLPFNTVLDDPEGLNVSVAAAQTSEIAYLREEMERQQRAMAAMQAQLQVRQMEEEARVAAGYAPGDGTLSQQATEQQVAAPETMPAPPAPTPPVPRVKGQPFPHGPNANPAPSVVQDGPGV